MESPQTVNEVPVKKNQTPMIVAISAVVLCCCCVAIGVAGYYGYNTLRIADVETMPFEPTAPDAEEFEPAPTPESSFEFEAPSFDTGVGEAPVGGLGNDILRNDTWQYVAFAAMGQGCDQPIGADTVIEVLQEPTNGVWVEKWTVACASGDTYPYQVDFILDDTGATFNIKSLP